MNNKKNRNQLNNNHMIVPFHGGGIFQELLVNEEDEQKILINEAHTLKKIKLTTLETSDLIMLGIGAFSPLNGFMIKSDYRCVLDTMHLNNGTLWPMPITLSISKEEADLIRKNDKIALIGPEKENIIGTMQVREKFSYDKEEEALKIFGTDDEKHPGVKKIYEKGDVYIGGEVRVFHEGKYPVKFPQYARPIETRRLFQLRRWETIVAFQTRNPIHRSHEYITKIVLEMYDGLFIHPIVGKLKEGDIPAEVRIKCYNTLLEKYYPKNKVILKVYPMEMRYGGPREAVLHAIIRQNFGCSHIIIGRDHAGVGNYYGPFDAQEIFDQFSPNELFIKPLKIDWTFWCNTCEQMCSKNTCPHSDEDHLLISGTELRKMLSEGRKPPAQFSRPEVLDILIEYYNSNNANS